MTWLLLFALTALVVLVPMLPAIGEWRWPSDVMPLPIDNRDALDPPFLARSFVVHLSGALALGQTRLGRSPLAEAPQRAEWPFDAGERRSASTRRVWHTTRSVTLPPDVNFLAEVAAHGDLRTAAGGVYRALWAGCQLRIAPHGTVLRWAHGSNVDVGSGCALAGRVSADHAITLRNDTSFTLLHAPIVSFLPAWSAPAVATAAVSRIGLPDAVAWDAVAGRGTCDAALDVGAHRAWRGDLVCRADLALGSGCNAHGSIKAHGDIAIAPGSFVAGSVIAAGRITLGAGCTVRGSVISEVGIVLGDGCVIGAPGHPATVAAPGIAVGAGVVVHGTLWAGSSGHTQARAVAGEVRLDAADAASNAAGIAASNAAGIAADIAAGHSAGIAAVGAVGHKSAKPAAAARRGMQACEATA